MTFLSEMDPSTGLIEPDRIKEKGLEFQSQYASANPFPHIAIDDFMPPVLLEGCLEDFPQASGAEHTYDRAQERLKRSFSPDHLPSRTRQLFYSFNSRPFIQTIENISGIRGLIPDPYFLGGGLHEISEGGHLCRFQSPHTDEP